VFAFIQRLRRLLGVYTRDAAAEELGVRPSRFGTKERAEQALVERGDTWAEGDGWSAGEQIASLFLHPINATAQSTEAIDPDRSLIAQNQARSAILFGPPGTSKTTIVEALAGAIGWDFVEIHASRFLSSGMDMVPSTADTIFKRLMELDRCVVLFDEIDELLRDRRDKDADPFGRFLTTSMLPKVATLWEQRRIAFFVATNDISGADPAIKRSQRFDSAVFVAPPSYSAKLKRLTALVPDIGDVLTKEDVERSLNAGEELGNFALLRHDQIEELVDRLEGEELSQELISTAVADIARNSLRREAHDRNGNDRHSNQLEAFQEMRQSETRDHRMIRVVCVLGGTGDLRSQDLEEMPPPEDHTRYFKLMRSHARPPEEIEIGSAKLHPDGILRYYA
jgi:SpoVK/Ycf46/Vps4 family AAA+-type ATPase